MPRCSLVALAAVALGLAVGSASAQPVPQVVQGGPGGVTAGSISGSTFNIQGLAEEQTARILAAIVRDKGVPQVALLAILARMGEANVSAEQVEARLQAKADEYLALRTELERWRAAARPDAAAARAQAAALLDTGDLEAARVALGQGRDRLRALREQTALEEAGLATAEAGVAELGLRYREAAALYVEAAGLVPDAEPLQQADYLDRAAIAFWGGGAFTDAEGPLRRAVAIREQRLGPNHVGVAVSLNNLGVVLAELGRRGEAEAPMRHSLVLREQAFGENDVRVADSLDGLGTLLALLGRRGETEPLFRRALEIREANFGPNDPAVVQSLGNLAILLVNLGRPNEAEGIARRAVNASALAFGPEHPATAVPLSNLAAALVRLGRSSGAVVYARRAVKISEQALGPYHPAVARALVGFAMVSAALGQGFEARQAMNRALDIRMRALGQDHPLTREARNTLGQIRLETSDAASSPGRVFQPSFSGLGGQQTFRPSAPQNLIRTFRPSDPTALRVLRPDDPPR